MLYGMGKFEEGAWVGETTMSFGVVVGASGVTVGRLREGGTGSEWCKYRKAKRH